MHLKYVRHFYGLFLVGCWSRCFHLFCLCAMLGVVAFAFSCCLRKCEAFFYGCISFGVGLGAFTFYFCSLQCLERCCHLFSVAYGDGRVLFAGCWVFG